MSIFRSSPVVFLSLLSTLTVPALSETYDLTLAQAVEVAARQNPDVAIARLEQQRAQEGIRVATDPFRPKVYGGSGLAYTYGYPNSIEGNAPSLFQAKTDMALYNRPDMYSLSSAREQARGAQFGAQARADDVGYQVADLYLTAVALEQQEDALNTQVPSLQKVVAAMTAAVSDGAELPLEQKRAQVNLALAQQRLDSARLDAEYYEMMLAVTLGYTAQDRVKPVTSSTTVLPTPVAESEAGDLAMKNNRELRQVQSNVLAKQLDLKSYQSARLPKIDLVAQYALFTKQNYEQYFGQRFQRNNAQLGVSITIPLLIGSAARGYVEQAMTDLQKLRLQMDQTRSRILSNTRRDYQQYAKAEEIRKLSAMQLDFAREQLNVLLAQYNEGRISMSRVEQARAEESDRWIALYDSEAQVTRAKLAILRETGTLLASLRASTLQQP